MRHRVYVDVQFEIKIPKGNVENKRPKLNKRKLLNRLSNIKEDVLGAIKGNLDITADDTYNEYFLNPGKFKISYIIRDIEE